MCIWGRWCPRSFWGRCNKWHFTREWHIKHCIANWKTSRYINSQLLHSFCFTVKQFSESAALWCWLQSKDYTTSHNNFIHGKFGWSDWQQRLKPWNMTDQFDKEWECGIYTDMKWLMWFSALNLHSLIDFHQSSLWEHVGITISRIWVNCRTVVHMTAIKSVPVWWLSHASIVRSSNTGPEEEPVLTADCRKCCNPRMMHTVNLPNCFFQTLWWASESRSCCKYWREALHNESVRPALAAVNARSNV